MTFWLFKVIESWIFWERSMLPKNNVILFRFSKGRTGAHDGQGDYSSCSVRQSLRNIITGLLEHFFNGSQCFLLRTCAVFSSSMIHPRFINGCPWPCLQELRAEQVSRSRKSTSRVADVSKPWKPPCWVNNSRVAFGFLSFPSVADTTEGSSSSFLINIHIPCHY